MSLLNFPTNPSPGDRWTVGAKIYQWTGNAWIVFSSSVTATSVTSDTLFVASTANSTSTTTGAVLIAGGVGIAKNVFIGGDITILGTINGFGAQGGVTVTTTNTDASFFVTFVSTSTGTLSSIETDAVGLTYNPSTHSLSVLGTLTAGSIQNTPIGTITPRDGYFTNITVSNTATINGASSATSTTTGALIVTGGVGIGGDLHLGGQLYSAGAFVLTTASFNNSPSDGQDIDIVDLGGGILEFNNISTLQTVTNRGHTTTNSITITNPTESESTITGAMVIKGGLGVGKRINCESIRIADSVFDSTEVALNTLATAVIDSYSVTEFRTAKYLVQIDDGIGVMAQFQVVEILLLANNAGTVFATEYGLVTSNGELGSFTADVQIDNIVRLYFTPFNISDKIISVLRIGMAA